MKLIAVVATSALYAAAAHAEMKTVQDVARAGDNKEVASYIGTNGEAFAWVNAELQSTGKDPVYCVPGELGITNNQYVSILRSYLDDYPSMKEVEFAQLPMVLLHALMQTFPCKN